MVTHESQLNEGRIKYYVDSKQISEIPRVNPNEMVLPPYHPDLPEIRKDWARLHDLIALMDKMSGDLLQELEDSGEADNTIVFFYSDHGGQLSRAKRYIYNVGTQVPMIVYLPPKWQHLAKQKPGETDDSLVSFVDLAKTVLSLTGCPVPDKMQGRVFLGPEIETALSTFIFTVIECRNGTISPGLLPTGNIILSAILCHTVRWDAIRGTDSRCKPTGRHGKIIMKKENVMRYSRSFLSLKQVSNSLIPKKIPGMLPELDHSLRIRRY
jgi:hypothetical protein